MMVLSGELVEKKNMSMKKKKMGKINAPRLSPYFSANSTVLLYRGRLEEDAKPGRSHSQKSSPFLHLVNVEIY